MITRSACGAILVLTLGRSAPVPAGTSTVFVDDDAPAGGDGQTWATAFRFLQDGLTVARAETNGATEIRVAQGVYRPDASEIEPNGTGDRTATFALVDGVALRGGFAGLGTVAPDLCDPESFVTVLDGDLLGDDDDTSYANASDNARTVVTAAGLSIGHEISGVTIEHGRFDNDGDGFGGAGLYVTDGAVRAEQCRFRRNYLTSSTQSLYQGAAIYVFEADLVMRNCMVDDNFATRNTVAPDHRGAGLGVRTGTIVLEKCEFRDNTARGGGAISMTFGDATIRFCRFENNRGGGGAIHCIGTVLDVASCEFDGNTWVDQAGSRHGGAIALDGSGGLDNDATFVNCIFRGGEANRGGLVYTFGNSVATFTNCLFTESEALTGSAIAVWGGDVEMRHCTITGNAATGSQGSAGFTLNGRLTLRNCIVWGNDTLDQLRAEIAVFPISVASSIVEGGWPGFAVVDADPGFADPAQADFRLAPGSPAIDAGDGNSIPIDELDLDGDGNVFEPLVYDLDGRPRVVDDPRTGDTGAGQPAFVDLGPYEYRAAGKRRVFSVFTDARPLMRSAEF